MYYIWFGLRYKNKNMKFILLITNERRMNSNTSRKTQPVVTATSFWNEMYHMYYMLFAGGNILSNQMQNEHLQKPLNLSTTCIKLVYRIWHYCTPTNSTQHITNVKHYSIQNVWYHNTSFMCYISLDNATRLSALIERRPSAQKFWNGFAVP